jgi:hypothetical protein
MENVVTERRGLVIILVIATVLIFVGLVWGIATYLPLNSLGLPSPSFTATPRVTGKNCTYSVSYWKIHPELYPPQLVIGGQVYNGKDIMAIVSDDTQDITVQLQVQLTSAYLNFLAGADQSSIETTIFEAYGWLVQHPVGSTLSDNERETGTRLFKLLETYNQGLTGVAPCEPGIAVTLAETSPVTETPTISVTMTASETLTPSPSETPTPIEFTATYRFIQPTSTTARTTEPPIQIPSSTPVIPTELPTATNTPPIPDTPTFTPPPPPTPTFTPPPLPSPTYTSPPPP